MRNREITRVTMLCAALTVLLAAACSIYGGAALLAVPIPPPVVWHDVTCWEGGVEVVYPVVRADLPGTWSEGGIDRRGVAVGPYVQAWRLDLGDGTEVVTTAPCRIQRGVE